MNKAFKSGNTGYFLLYLLIFTAFLFPVFNPDLFWHLAAARSAAGEGKWFLSQEIFSFTKNGTFWLNFEWLFEWIAYKIYLLDGFRAIVWARALIFTATVGLMDLYFLRLTRNRFPDPVFSHFLRVANILFTFLFLSTRGSFQPEAFSLIFLILLMHLRDAMFRNPRSIALWASFAALLCVWANIHGGFAYGLGMLGLQWLARLLEYANTEYKKRFLAKKPYPGVLKELHREIFILTAMGALGVIAACLNPYGIKIYEAIFAHLKDSSIVSIMINEWTPSQFSTRDTWPYFILLFFLAFNLLWRAFVDKEIVWEGLLILGAFGQFASSHVRNVALFGIVCLPVFWRYSDLEVGRRVLARLNRWSIAFALFVSLGFLGWVNLKRVRDIAKNGMPYTWVRTDTYPHQALYFLEGNPELIRLNTLTEWGWGGYATWRLYEKGLRIYFDGRYLFHDDLYQALGMLQDPASWKDFSKSKNIDLCVLKYPRNPDDYRLSRVPAIVKGASYDSIPRSWHALAMDEDEWALIWWDQSALVFVRRNKVDAAWLKSRQYKTRIPYDPYEVERQVKAGKIKVEDLYGELLRNEAEAGSNKRNGGLIRAVYAWQQELKAK